MSRDLNTIPIDTVPPVYSSMHSSGNARSYYSQDYRKNLTHSHITNRYATDILKLGPDGRLYKGKEEAVTDFYSYNEAIYAPADGQLR